LLYRVSPGYLAFIGYFCVQAGTALCISRPLVSPLDWVYLFDGDNLLLAVPGLLAALLLTYISRVATNDALLPLTMVAIPAVFYIVIYATGAGLEGAREGHWVGDVAPPVPVNDLFKLVDFRLVRWDCVGEILWTWVGMVFVVSFASCLDVAAIAMDKGEALDTNRELATVGCGNCECDYDTGILWFCALIQLTCSNYPSDLYIYTCSDVGVDFRIHRIVHFLPDDLHVPDRSPFEMDRRPHHVRLLVHRRFARQHTASGAAILSWVDIDLHWVRSNTSSSIVCCYRIYTGDTHTFASL